MAAAGLLAAPPAEAAPSGFWPDYYEPYPPPRFAPPRLRKSTKKQVPKREEIAKDSRKPQGPLIIAISIDKQLLKIYDANGSFAETPISTGMRGHSTPMGVFSVIQKRKYHHSNIYSGAPMPYMQRITWSGVAMHAGVLPGYPASHGCIRMPMSFAVKMWGWTRMGARVVITPGELAPERFSHPLLATQKIPPAAVAQTRVDVDVTAKSDKAVMAAAVPPAFSEAGLELKSTVGHDLARPAPNKIAGSPALREQTHTADASSALSRSPATLIDAPVASNPTQSVDEAKPEGKAMDASPAVPDIKKDQARPSDRENAAAPNPEPAVATAPRRGAQIAVFISKKDGRLYVRQNFAPLFDVPVAIAASDRPLGTHIFTAQTHNDDANRLHWSVISLPVMVRSPARQDDDESVTRRRRITGAIEVKPAPAPDSAGEALDRLTIPADAMTRIAELLSTGGSIIVSDQGINGGETGEGTDFIIPLR